MTYAKPYEVIIQFDSSENASPEKRPNKIKRSKKGCFNCRKRKKKCDECKPSCSSCISKCIPCVWPKDENQKLPKEYQIPETDESLKSVKFAVKTFIPVTFSHIDSKLEIEPLEPLEPQSPDIEFTEIAPISPVPPSTILNIPANPETAMSPVAAKSIESTPEPLDTELFTPKFCTKGIQLTMSIEDKFRGACVNGFITSVGPQYTHPLLTTSATFTPFIDNNPIMQSIASACGCAFLSWNDPSLTELSYKKYLKASRMMHEYLDSNDALDNTWVCAGWQMLCLCTKITLKCSTRHSNEALKMSYQTIKEIVKRITHNSKSNNSDLLVIGPSRDIYNLDDFTNDSLKLEIENSLIHFEHKPSISYIDKQFERMFIESFVYNYNVGILVCATTDCLPSPFVVFSDLRAALKTPLFSCDVAWMNNPVLGASFDAYELAAKASYLIRHLNDPMTLGAAKRLYEVAKFLPVPMIPTELRIDPLKFQNLRDSTLIADVILESAKIMLLKIINIELSESDPSIQKQVELVIKRLKQTTECSPCKLIATWALLVCGVCCITEEQRMVITQNCSEIGESTHGCYLLTVLKALNIAWGRDPTHYLSGGGIDVLLHGEFLSEISL